MHSCRRFLEKEMQRKAIAISLVVKKQSTVPPRISNCPCMEIHQVVLFSLYTFWLFSNCSCLYGFILVESCNPRLLLAEGTVQICGNGIVTFRAGSTFASILRFREYGLHCFPHCIHGAILRSGNSPFVARHVS